MSVQTPIPNTDVPENASKKPRHRQLRATFESLGVPVPLTEYLTKQGINEPFPIQEATLPDSLAGRDVLGRGRTGSGKTLAFSLPVVTRLASQGGRRQPKAPRAIILAPTRELANQIHATIEPLAELLGLRTVVIYGGVSAAPQISALRRGVDIVVACPGRLLDHYRSGLLEFDNVSITVIDEADHMADLGFLPDVRTIMDGTPANSQRLLFSATLDRDVNTLVKRYLTNPLTHSVDSDKAEASSPMIHHVLHVDSGDRFAVMADLAMAPGKTIIFTRTRHGAIKLTQQLTRHGVATVDLHGNLSQAARARNLAAFTSGRANTLVATDIAARGIHVDDVGLVVHADPPAEHKAYLHRSGRTARAGAAGTVVTMMTGAQTRAVRDLTKRAGINPRTTRVRPGDELLNEIAPGERVATALAPEPRSEKTFERREKTTRGPRRSGASRRTVRNERSREDNSQQSTGSRNSGKQSNQSGYRGGSRKPNADAGSSAGRSHGRRESAQSR